ncbi:hypothetical protein A3B39_02940 [Candidatus Daviesbacteria bacterium RIFCSPLOWO2_01_FULL_37_10]|nr:MAG: hypothetical protein A2111_00525 [Candidatus Daviesbacteria bacterium GWA1_38_6]OGE46255.1 MAG: hypothetical protein A3B39_02940 [Candidatus Daviesbacteria bacterium RIFCSPLOWO2_01_FULL_37_10]
MGNRSYKSKMRASLKREVKKMFGINLDRNFSTRIINELEGFAIKGIRFTLESITELYLKPNQEDEMEVRFAKYIARKWILALKKRFSKRGEWFGGVNSKRQYGFIKTEKEYEYVRKRELKIRRGIIENNSVLLEEFKRKFPESFKEWNES